MAMSKEHYQLLQDRKKEVCQFLEVRDGLLDTLTRDGVFTKTNRSSVLSLKEVSSMAHETVNIILDKPDSDVEKFISALNENNQSHVAYLLTGAGKPPMSEEHYNIMRSKMKELCDFLDAENGVSVSMYSADIINPCDRDRIRSATGYSEKAYLLIETIMRKSDDSFDGLIDALNENEQSHVSYILTGVGKLPMTNEHCGLLKCNTKKLCKFLDVENGLLVSLYSGGIISAFDRDIVRSASGYNKMAERLIKIIMRKSDDAFDAFAESLNDTEQAHVTYILTGQGNSRPLHEEFRKKLTENRTYLVETIDSKHSGLITTLVSKGVFSEYDQQRAQSTEIGIDRAEIIMDLMARKSQASFDRFVVALEETGQKHVAVEFIGAEVVARIMASARSGAHVPEADVRQHIADAIERDGDEVQELHHLLQTVGISVSDIREGSIIVIFRCKNSTSLKYLKCLQTSGYLGDLLTKAFCPTYKDIESLSVDISVAEVERCEEIFRGTKLMTSEHREAMNSSVDGLVDKMTVGGDLLDKLSLCRRRRQAIEQASTREQQVKTLLDVVSRQPDSAFTQLLDALHDTEQHDACELINSFYNPYITEWKQSDDMLECPICTKVYTDPRVLPCVHTFCLKCIEGFTRDEMACPLCRKEFAVPRRRLRYLPKNVLVTNLMKKVKMKKSSIGESLTRPCEACSGGKDSNSEVRNVASVYCVKCQMELCRQCEREHKTITLTRSHRLISVGGRQHAGKGKDKPMIMLPSEFEKKKRMPFWSLREEPKDEMDLCVPRAVLRNSDTKRRSIGGMAMRTVTAFDMARTESDLHGGLDQLRMQCQASNTDFSDAKRKSSYLDDRPSDERLEQPRMNADKTAVKSSTAVVPVTHIISSQHGRGVRAVTTLGDQVFAGRWDSKEVEVYDAVSLQLQHHLRVPGLSGCLFGLAACPVNNCLYASECHFNYVHRVELSGSKAVKKWSVATGPRGLSVNKAHNVVVACWGADKLQEYTTHGFLVRHIIFRYAYDPWQGVQLSTGHYAVSHGGSRGVVSVVGVDGKVVHSYRKSLSPDVGHMSGPICLAVTKNDVILVADEDNNRILSMNRSLSSIQELALSVDGGIQGPWYLCLDESRGRLYVGEDGGDCRLLVFDGVKL